ncbi:hypothetical protein D3C80_1954030 [compost metagenome]
MVTAYIRTGFHRLHHSGDVIHNISASVFISDFAVNEHVLSGKARPIFSDKDRRITVFDADTIKQCLELVRSNCAVERG